jgi:hypothetical protein
MEDRFWGANTSLWLHEQEESSVRYLMGNGDRSDLACAAFAYNLDAPSDFTNLSVCTVERTSACEQRSP